MMCTLILHDQSVSRLAKNSVEVHLVYATSSFINTPYAGFLSHILQGSLTSSAKLLSGMLLFGMLLSSLQPLLWGLPTLTQNFVLPSGYSAPYFLIFFLLYWLSIQALCLWSLNPHLQNKGNLFVIFCLLDAKLLFFRSFSWIIWCLNLGQYVNVRKLNYVLLLCLPLHSSLLSVTFSPFRSDNRSLFYASFGTMTISLVLILNCDQRHYGENGPCNTKVVLMGNCLD